MINVEAIFVFNQRMTHGIFITDRSSSLHYTDTHFLDPQFACLLRRIADSDVAVKGIKAPPNYSVERFSAIDVVLLRTMIINTIGTVSHSRSEREFTED